MIKLEDILKDKKYKIREGETCWISDIEQKSEEWHEIRKGRIGGSSIGTCVGHNKWAKYEEKNFWENLGKEVAGTKKKEFDELAIFRMGKGVEYEPKARKIFERAIKPDSSLKKKDGKGIVSEVGVCIWKKDDRFHSSPDGLFYKDGKKCGVEIKCPQYISKDIYDGLIYENYMDQIVMCKEICGLDIMYYFVYGWGRNEWHMMEVDIEEGRWDEIYEKGRKFYDKYVFPHL